MNARDGEIKYAEELGLKLEETPEEYRLNFASHLSQMPWASQLGYDKVLLSKKQQVDIKGRLTEIAVEKDILRRRNDILIEQLNLGARPLKLKREIKTIADRADKLSEEEYQLGSKLAKHNEKIEREKQKLTEVESKYSKVD
jgi:hypothetical protein